MMELERDFVFPWSSMLVSSRSISLSLDAMDIACCNPVSLMLLSKNTESPVGNNSNSRLSAMNSLPGKSAPNPLLNTSFQSDSPCLINTIRRAGNPATLFSFLIFSTSANDNAGSILNFLSLLNNIWSMPIHSSWNFSNTFAAAMDLPALAAIYSARNDPMPVHTAPVIIDTASTCIHIPFISCSMLFRPKSISHIRCVNDFMASSGEGFMDCVLLFDSEKTRECIGVCECVL
mmetsp:Transcript_19637/g.33672  ORF Transcript_19637/g.33672 Transcript_19637/m.33672 type:complete len:233 (-) Transcript_19637:351-1049(-)